MTPALVTLSSVTLPIVQLPHAQDLPLPDYATPLSAGMDLRAALEEPLILEKGERTLVPTGLSLALPSGYEAQIRPRSGLAYKSGVTLLNSPGTIDADYRGEIKALLINLGDESVHFQHGDRIAQMVIAPVARITWAATDNLSETERGKGGFGSTGFS